MHRSSWKRCGGWVWHFTGSLPDWLKTQYKLVVLQKSTQLLNHGNKEPLSKKGWLRCTFMVFIHLLPSKLADCHLDSLTQHYHQLAPVIDIQCSCSSKYVSLHSICKGYRVSLCLLVSMTGEASWFVHLHSSHHFLSTLVAVRLKEKYKFFELIYFEGQKLGVLSLLQ